VLWEALLFQALEQFMVLALAQGWLKGRVRN
jgi:hypothetical protein